MDVFQLGGFGGIFGGNLVVCVVVIVVFDWIENDGLFVEVVCIECVFKLVLFVFQVKYLIIVEVCGIGVMLVVELNDLEIGLLLLEVLGKFVVFVV